jgi:hypothetical protein
VILEKFATPSDLELEAILTGDLQPRLPSEVREVLLDVVLAWANLHVVTAFFLSSVTGLDPDDGARRYGRREIADKLKRASKALQEKGNGPLADRVQETADLYQEKSFYRRGIAHSKCAGVRKSDPTQLIFLPFEQEGPPGHLAMEVFNIELFQDAVEWAKSEHDFYLNQVDDAAFFEPR